MKPLAALLALFAVVPVARSEEPLPPQAKQLLAGVRRIVFLGDSITQAGDYVVDVESWLLAHGQTVEVLNLGLGSETATDLSAEENAGHLQKYGFGRPFVSERLARVLAATKPDLLFACYGMNDGGSLPADDSGTRRFAEAITRLRDQAIAAGVKRVVLLTPPVHDAKGDASLKAADENLTRYSAWLVGQRAVGWQVVDIHSPMRAALDANRAKDPAFEFAKDGVHPGREGHWLMAREILTQAFGARIDGVSRAEDLFPANGEKIRKLVRDRMVLLFNAWMTQIGHQRPNVAGGPGGKPGLPVAEADTKAAEIARLIAREMETTGAGAVPLEVDEVAPVRVEQRGQALFADFGKAAYGNLRIEFAADPPVGEWIVRLGEKLLPDGAIDRKPPGSVNYRELKLSVTPSQRVYKLTIPSKPFHNGTASVKTPAAIGEVTVFRYAEIEGPALASKSVTLRQLFVHAPFDDAASSFTSSDETLNAVWNLCKHTMKATTAFGVYIDGERERIPYEADAYINLLSHYAVDLDARMARATFAHLLAHPTWPTEWSLHMPMIAAADYLATGDAVLARDNYDKLKQKLLIEKAREDGLLQSSAIVDWPAGERDGYNDSVVDPKQRQQAGPMINTVANAFYFHALEQMAILARALNKEDDARDFERKAGQVRASFQRVFFDAARGVYVDGEGSPHASLHANMFALAFGLAPAQHVAKVADFVQSRGMACSVYGAQYLLEALFGAGRDEYAVQLMTAKTERSWWHMIESGSTMTWEAWGPQFKPNLTWNHCGAQKVDRSLCSLLFQAIFLVKSAENGHGNDAVTGGEFVSVRADRNLRLNWFRNTRPQRRVGPSAIVMVREFGHDSSEMTFVDRDEVVEALAPDGSDQPLAPGVGGGRADRSLQHPKPAIPDRLIDIRREDRIAVMNQKLVRMVEGEKFPELLDAPFGCRMRGDVGVQDAARADLHRHEDVEKAKRSGDRNEEIAGNDARRVIADESGPSLAVVSMARACRFEILPDRAGRNPDSELH